MEGGGGAAALKGRKETGAEACGKVSEVAIAVGGGFLVTVTPAAGGAMTVWVMGGVGLLGWRGMPLLAGGEAKVGGDRWAEVAAGGTVPSWVCHCRAAATHTASVVGEPMRVAPVRWWWLVRPKRRWRMVELERQRSRGRVGQLADEGGGAAAFAGAGARHSLAPRGGGACGPWVATRWAVGGGAALTAAGEAEWW